ncbi:unnamed protein product [Candidula unifasciata]|uniref:RING-type domain-containing protein n=1 Tax=Candidula unifasciata TaxID=100452 RepID=A0A8S3ZSS4_9EUPU|nr:unnamed protein product [Candidula unifasciata]
MNPGMRYEVLRLQSFKHARLDDLGHVSVILLAEVGFYFDHITDRVLCFSCGYEYLRQFSSILRDIVHESTCQRHELNKSIRDTTFGLTPDVIQQEQLAVGQQINGHDFSSVDSFRERLPSNNGTLHDSPNTHPNQITLNNEQQQYRSTIQDPQSRDRLTLSPCTTTPQTTYYQAGTVTERQSASGHPALNISSVSYPHFSTRQARIATFASWSPAHSHRPDDFADLGFFFTGNADCVRCFCCGLGLKYWRPTDDIAYQHSRLRPSCAFNRLCKGQTFVDRVTQQIQAVPANVHTNAAVITDGVTSPVVSTNGLVTPFATTDVRNPSLASSHSNNYTDSNSSEDSGFAHASYANGDSPLEVTNGILAEAQQATPTVKALTISSLRNEELQVVERENLLLSARTTCRLCQAASVSCIFLPCGHVAACQDCADKVERCVLCSKVIIGTANIYLS